VSSSSLSWVPPLYPPVCAAASSISTTHIQLGTDERAGLTLTLLHELTIGGGSERHLVD
jgi:hypothetical protein